MVSILLRDEKGDKILSLYKDIDFDKLEEIRLLSENLFARVLNRNIAKGKRVHSANSGTKLDIVKKNTVIECDTKILSEQGFGRYDVSFAVRRKERDLFRCSCTCIDYKNNSYRNKTYMCKHIIGAIFCLFDSLKEENCFKEDEATQDIFLDIFKDSLVKKDSANLEVFIGIDRRNIVSNFEVSLKIGHEKLYVVKDIIEFFESRKKGLEYPLGKQFTYNIKNKYFTETNERFLNILENKVSSLEKLRMSYGVRGIRTVGVKGKLIKLPLEALRSFLQEIAFMKVNITIDGQMYENTEVVLADLPLEFTIKCDEDVEIISKPFDSLNEDNDVFYYAEKLYIPSYEQRSYFSKINKILLRGDSIKLPKEKLTTIFENVLPVLNLISKEVILDEKIKEKVEDGVLKTEFYVDRERKVIKIDNKIMYGESTLGIDNGKYIIRDLEKENEISRVLNELGFIQSNAVYRFTQSDDELFYFINKGVEKLKKLGEVFYSESFKKYQVISKPAMSAGVKEKKDYLDFTFKIEKVDKKKIPKILEAFKEKKKFFKLDEDSFLDLSDRELFNFIALIDNIENVKLSSGKDSIRVNKNRAFYLNDYISEKNLSFIKGKEFLDEISTKFKNIKSMEFDVPKELCAELRDYQVEGYKWLQTLSYYGFSGILADEMGLGKTIQTITYILANRGKKSLVVTPTALIYNWKNEFEKFAPCLNIGIIHGSKKEREKVLNNLGDYDVILSTYGTVKNDVESYKDLEFDIMVIDEAQNIKNSNAKSSLAVKAINARQKFALTGTPIENNLLELWSIFDYVMPGYLFNKSKFTNKFVKGSNEYEELKRAIEPFILRREKSEVAKELPDKIEKKFFVELSKEQKKLYSTYVKSIRKDMENKDSNNKIEVFSYLMKLRQLCLEPKIVYNDYSGENSKLNMAMNLVDGYASDGHKILLFSQFTGVLDSIKNEIEAKGIEYSYIDGSVEARKRLELVDQFNESDTKRVFLISLKAGGTGLNLTSADVVIHYDPWWNPAVEDQATDRAHRIGQENNVEVIKLISKGTIEEKILKLQESKKNIIEKVMTGKLANAGLLSSLSENELIDLFESDF
jgi:SNF2 family DNA or RNA helicase